MNNADLKQAINNLRKKINELEEKIKEPVKKDNPFEFADGEKYWYLETMGDINSSNFTSSLDKNRRDRGNAFKSSELAEREKDKRVLIQEIEKWKWENDEKFELCQTFRCNYIAFDENEGLYSANGHFNSPLGMISSKSKDMAQSALEHFGDRLKILFLPKYTL